MEMNITAVQNIITAKYTLEMLDDAEMALINEEQPTIDIEGANDGEQLTHIFAAKWIIEEMQRTGVNFEKALKAYGLKVKKSDS